MIKLLLPLLLALLTINANAETHRSQKAKTIFKYSHPCPSTGRPKGSCPGYIIESAALPAELTPT